MSPHRMNSAAALFVMLLLSFAVAGAVPSTELAPEVKALVPTAKNIRSFEVQHTVSLFEQSSCGGAWQIGPPMLGCQK